jgi:hypothetical protein
MILDLCDTNGMTDRADNSTFLLPRVNAAKQVYRTIVDLDSYSLGLATGATLQGVLNLFPQFFRFDFPGRNGDLVDDADNTSQPQNGPFCILPFVPPDCLSLERHPAT